jgi:hypothetical protein
MAEPQQHAWQQQPGESIRTYRAFAIFRNLEPHERSLSRVSSELAKSIPLIKRWSSRWSWTDRVRDWDNFQELRRLEACIKEKQRIKEYAPLLQELLDEGAIRLDGQPALLAGEDQDEDEDGEDEMLTNDD